MTATRPHEAAGAHDGPPGEDHGPPGDGRGPSVADLRHRAEVPMLVMAGALTAGAVLLAVALLASDGETPDWALVVLAGLATPLVASAVVLRYQYWRTAANAVEVTPRQFPEVHQLFAELGERMGLDPLPRLYVANGNGVLDAYATKCEATRAYVVIYSDLLDLLYEHGDRDGVRFVLAHELGHVKERHVSLWRLAVLPVPRMLLLSRSVVRAQEYSADRVASCYAPEGARSLLALYAGKRLYRRVDTDAYDEAVRAHPDGFWLRVANLLSDHPVGFRRMEALARVPDEGWDVHGRML